MTRFLSWFAGGFDYAVIYIIDGILVFDTGFAWARRSLTRYLKKTGLDKSIKYVVNSHFHEDHIGNNDTLNEICSCEVYAHEEGVKHIKYYDEKEFYRHFLFGSYTAVDVQSCLDSYPTKNYSFQPIHTPGHTPDHICLYDPGKKVLLSGDLFIHEHVDSQLKEVDGPLWINSLEQVLGLDIELLLDGHGIFIDGENKVKAALNAKIAYLKMIQTRVNEISKAEYSIEKITQMVFNDKSLVNTISFHEGWMSFITGGSFSRSNLVKSFLK